MFKILFPGFCSFFCELTELIIVEMWRLMPTCLKGQFGFISLPRPLGVMMNGPAHSGCSICRRLCETPVQDLRAHRESAGSCKLWKNQEIWRNQRFVSCFDFFASSPATKRLFALISFVAETLRKEESHRANIRLTPPKPGSEIQKYKKLFCTGG